MDGKGRPLDTFLHRRFLEVDQYEKNISESSKRGLISYEMGRGTITQFYNNQKKAYRNRIKVRESIYNAKRRWHHDNKLRNTVLSCLQIGE